MPRASPARPASNADHDTLSASPGAEKNPGNRKVAAQTLQTINFYSYFLETPNQYGWRTDDRQADRQRLWLWNIACSSPLRADHGH
jgi:hypothetical protein